MGTAFSVEHAVAAVRDLLAEHNAADVKVPIDKIAKVVEMVQEVKTAAFNSQSALNSVTDKILETKGTWHGLAHAGELIDDAHHLLDQMQHLKDQWVAFSHDISGISIAAKKKMLTWDEIMSGPNGPMLLMVSFLEHNDLVNAQRISDIFSKEAVDVHTRVYKIGKEIHDMRAEKSLLAHNVDAELRTKYTTFVSNLKTVLYDTKDVLSNMNAAASCVLQSFTGLINKHKINVKPVPPSVWDVHRNGRNLDNFPVVVSLPLSEFDVVSKHSEHKFSYLVDTPAKKRKIINDEGTVVSMAPRSQHRMVALALTDKKDDDAKTKRKKDLKIAQDRAFAQVNGHLTAQKETMKNDITKSSAVSVAVEQATPAKPSDNDNIWDQFATASKNIGDWAGEFVTAMQKAPIENDTRREIFDVCQTFYHLMQTTSLKLQGYRLSIGKIGATMENVINVLIPPQDIQQDMKSMANNPEKVKQIQSFAKMNKDALSSSLKDLSKLLNDNKALNDLEALHKSWGDLQKSIENVQVDVKQDIEDFKKRMKTISWITMGITAVVGLVVVIGTMGAAAPEVAAVAGEEVAEEAAIEALEVGTDVAVDTMVDGAVDGAIDAGEAEVEAEGSVSSFGSKALNIFTKIGKGIVTVGVLGGLSEGAKALVDKIKENQLEVIGEAKKGLDHIADDVNLIETMLFFIYKHWSELDQDPVLNNNDPYAARTKAWGRVDVKPLLKSLSSNQEILDTIATQLKATEDDIDGEIGNYNTLVFQPLQKIFG